MGEPEPSALALAVRLDGDAALPRASRLDSPLDLGINLGNPPPLPKVSGAPRRKHSTPRRTTPHRTAPHRTAPRHVRRSTRPCP